MMKSGEGLREVRHVRTTHIVEEELSEGLLTCPRCKTKKPATEEFFTPNRGRPNITSGFKTWCKACGNAYQNAKNDGMSGVDKWLRRMRHYHHLDREQLIALLRASNGACDICHHVFMLDEYGTGFNKKKSLQCVVDHDHACCDRPERKTTCGECARGFICYPCNISLGYYEKWQRPRGLVLAPYDVYLADPPSKRLERGLTGEFPVSTNDDRSNEGMELYKIFL